MSDSVRLVDIVPLQRAWEDYQSAGFGRLNTTADELSRVASLSGWGGRHHDLPLLLWVKRRLGIPA